MGTAYSILGFNISKMNGTVDSLIDDFDEMILEMASLEMLNPRMEYAVSSQFVERLEESGKINATEKLRLKDILEEPDGKPKRGNTREQMKRELKREEMEGGGGGGGGG